jgi:hypothetical protein
MDLFVWLEQTALGTWVRESPTIWAYPTVLFLHTLGLAILVGLNAAIDVRILGLASELPVAPLKRLFPLMWAGFGINAFSGLLLMIADASTKMTNPVFYVKLVFVGLAVANAQLLKTRILDNPLIDKGPMVPMGRLLAGTSLFFWAGAITAGRLMAYIGPVSGLE